MYVHAPRVVLCSPTPTHKARSTYLDPGAGLRRWPSASSVSSTSPLSLIIHKNLSKSVFWQTRLASLSRFREIPGLKPLVIAAGEEDINIEKSSQKLSDAFGLHLPPPRPRSQMLNEPSAARCTTTLAEHSDPNYIIQTFPSLAWPSSNWYPDFGDRTPVASPARTSFQLRND